RISIMGILNKGAGILAPLIFAAVVLKSTDNALFEQIPLMAEAERNAALDALIQRVILPYTVVGFVLIGLGLMGRYSPLPEIDTGHADEALAQSNSIKTRFFHLPRRILGAVAIFVHVGIQVIAIDTVLGSAPSMDIHLVGAK